MTMIMATSSLRNATAVPPATIARPVVARRRMPRASASAARIASGSATTALRALARALAVRRRPMMYARARMNGASRK